jgi:hypothetical protein
MDLYVLCVPPDFVNEFIINTLYTYKYCHPLALQISKLVLPLQNSIKHQRYRARTLKKWKKIFFSGKNIHSNFWKWIWYPRKRNITQNNASLLVDNITIENVLKTPQTTELFSARVLTSSPFCALRWNFSLICHKITIIPLKI